MRKPAYALVTMAVAAAAFGAGSLHEPRVAVSAASLQKDDVLYYRCPMHPHIRSDTPGTAPCCGMPFEPVYAPDGAVSAHPHAPALAPRALIVPPGKQQLIGVRVQAVERTSGTERLRLFGRVSAEETRVYTINVGLDGYIRDLAPVTTGSQVRKDQWLATFVTPEARQPISAYLQTLDVLDRETKIAGSTQQVAAAVANRQLAVDRLLAIGMSPLQLQELQQTRASANTVKVSSPVNGFVVARHVSAGEKFDRGAALFQIADLGRVWILADVPASEGVQVAPGMAAQVTLADRRTQVAARVSREVLPQFDAATQSYKVRLEADNPGFLLRPSMFVDVELEIPFPPSMLVPAEAVVMSGLRNHVFVETSPGVLEPRAVELGRRVDSRVIVERGLEPSQRFAVSGTFLLDSESRMNGHDHQPHH
jgi:membrane fusion protein, copper/silver efflux system